ncbi:MAG: GlsB/YeaQ/YmgE family stress response membrane protein [bacterium]|nr:GlsB/YeaQ/YmgE family stress response membrane protein [bacterium]
MSLYDIIAWVVMGALVGWIASKIMGTDAEQGGLANIVVGIVGAFAGGFLMSLIDKPGVNEADAISWRSFLVALLGAVVVLFVYKAVSRRT